ncbi:hypothetical protein DSECCO2_487990 [anaerobic digester metagenome]
MGVLDNLAAEEHLASRGLDGLSPHRVDQPEHLSDRAPKGLLDRNTEQGRSHGVHQGDAAVGVGRDHPVCDRGEGDGQALLLLCERTFCPTTHRDLLRELRSPFVNDLLEPVAMAGQLGPGQLSFGDVPGDAEDPDRPVPGEVELGLGANLDQPLNPIVGDDPGQSGMMTLMGVDGRQPGPDGRLIVLCKEDREVTADERRPVVPRQGLGRPVDGRESPCGIDGEEEVPRLLDEPAVPLLVCPDQGLGPLERTEHVVDPAGNRGDLIGPLERDPRGEAAALSDRGDPGSEHGKARQDRALEQEHSHAAEDEPYEKEGEEEVPKARLASLVNPAPFFDRQCEDRDSRKVGEQAISPDELVVNRHHDRCLSPFEPLDGR